jgi:2-(1,2-epoxy-1,2-dihydrophenyl)acetyl-CoA isomerase
VTAVQYESITCEKREGVGFLQLNRPQSMNALEKILVDELIEALNELESDRKIGAVLITGKDKAFCAGGDLRRMVEGFNPVDGQGYLKTIHPLILKIANFVKPVIAAVNGYAVGAGFNMALVCDIVYASEQAKFGQAFVNVGLISDLGGMFFLPRLVGLQKAKELIFTGQQIDAEEAYRLGIVNRVYPAEQLQEEAYSLARKLAGGPRLALSQAKKILNLSISMNLEALLEMEAYAQGLCFQTEDHKEATKAFLEQRKPVFKGE